MFKNKINFLQIILSLFLICTQAAFFFAEKDITTYTISFILSSAVYLLFTISTLKFEFDNKKLWLLIFIFFLIKILFITTEPIGSDDYYRYIWDGKVQLNGINPYLYKPNAEELNSLHSDLLPDKVSFPNIKTIYFPVAQWIFVLAYKVSGENAIGLKLIYLLFELITLFALYFLLKRFVIDRKYLLLYATLPLITFQFFIDAHIDIVGTALMIASIAFYFYDKKLFSYILLGLSLSVKPTGLLLLPFYFQNVIALKEKVKSVIIPIIVFVITFLPYLFTATPLDTLVNYSVNWTFNGMIYNTLRLIISNNYTIRFICGILFILVFVYLYFIKIELIKKIYLSLFLLMIFSPVVHPWYLIWFAVLLPVMKSYSGIYFVSIISLTFLTVIKFQTTGVWNESTVILLIEYIPLAAIFFYELLKQEN
ncbi:Hypothetical protein IALB_1970 [Ignavibacterium album JCM 16511]|uniref:DUF2029 domain-containing protein n=1 Tax=Ignavibacterium album (strain DSM 19864 / JCM 16511 / NBRC 101810 / Mat9-16) TaxID=945713 RepID=I0AL19_IGNAJ|nr:Hypothetical protein IALB_1970 [Ignavibacterium album JCM 16511]